eukprot:1630457-Rhodomonas_salina.1
MLGTRSDADANRPCVWTRMLGGSDIVEEGWELFVGEERGSGVELRELSEHHHQIHLPRRWVMKDGRARRGLSFRTDREVGSRTGEVGLVFQDSVLGTAPDEAGPLPRHSGAGARGRRERGECRGGRGCLLYTSPSPRDRG